MSGGIVKVKFYSPYDRLAGVPEVLIEIRDGATVGDLLIKLLRMFPVLTKVIKIGDAEELSASTLLMADEQVVSMGTMLSPGQDLKIMPFILGG